MGLTQILASHGSGKVWIWLGPVSNLLCHRCLFDSWSSKHEAEDPAVEKKLCSFGLAALGRRAGMHAGPGPLHPGGPERSALIEEHVGSPALG